MTYNDGGTYNSMKSRCLHLCLWTATADQLNCSKLPCICMSVNMIPSTQWHTLTCHVLKLSRNKCAVRKSLSHPFLLSDVVSLCCPGWSAVANHRQYMQLHGPLLLCGHHTDVEVSADTGLTWCIMTLNSCAQAILLPQLSLRVKCFQSWTGRNFNY
jgi:hypothetical protein